MKLGLRLGYHADPYRVDMDQVRLAEALGYDAVWVSEAYGPDAVSPCAWILAQTTRIRCGTAVLQIPARTPAMAAMTAMTLDALSGGRFMLGVGPSSARLVEGWHGQAFGKPLTRTREYIQIIREILRREAPLDFQGEHYQAPYRQADATGLGRALKSMLPARPDLPIYTGTVSPGGLEVAAEVADGVIPLLMDPERFEIFQPALTKGFGRAGGGKGLAAFDVAPFVLVALDDDLDSARLEAKRFLAPYLGAMGPRANYYADYAGRLGWAAQMVEVQRLYAEGRAAEAVDAVPDGLCDQVALVGSKARIRDRLAAWREADRNCHVSTMLIGGASPGALRLLAEEML